MHIRRLSVLASACLAIVACGGSTASVGGDGSGTDAAPDGGSNDAASDAPPSDGGCIADPTEGTACTPGQTACGSGGDICCIGYAWLCDPTTHTWKKAAVGCACIQDAGAADTGPADAGSFACGADTCNGAQYCLTISGGAQLPDGGTNVSHSCQDIPAACLATPTCACLKAHQTTCGDLCSDTDGHLGVQCLAP